MNGDITNSKLLRMCEETDGMGWDLVCSLSDDNYSNMLELEDLNKGNQIGKFVGIAAHSRLEAIDFMESYLEQSELEYDWVYNLVRMRTFT
jgi:hypothetical protein